MAISLYSDVVNAASL